MTRNGRDVDSGGFGPTVLYAVVGLVYLVTFLYLFEALLATYFDDLASATEVLSGLSSLILVVLTALYVRETRRIVRTERELRQEDAVEEWYESMLSLVRQLTFEWDYQLAMHGDREGLDFDDDSGRFETLESLVRSLETEARRSPSGVDEDLLDLLDDFFYKWRQLKSSNRMHISHNSDAENTLIEVQSMMEEDSDRFGRG